jgi:hypothetical protein
VTRTGVCAGTWPPLMLPTGPALTVGAGPSHRCSAVIRSQRGRVVTYGGGSAAGYIKGTSAMPAARRLPVSCTCGRLFCIFIQ